MKDFESEIWDFPCKEILLLVDFNSFNILKANDTAQRLWNMSLQQLKSCNFFYLVAADKNDDKEKYLHPIHKMTEGSTASVFHSYFINCFRNAKKMTDDPPSSSISKHSSHSEMIKAECSILWRWRKKNNVLYAAGDILTPPSLNESPLHSDFSEDNENTDSWRGILNTSKSDETIYFYNNIIQTILENTASGLFLVDSLGHPTYMNSAAERMTGYFIDELKGKHFHLALHHTRPDGSPFPLEECSVYNIENRKNNIQNEETHLVDKNGRIFPIIWSIARLEKFGEFKGTVIEFRDVTIEKKQKQDKINAIIDAEKLQMQAHEALLHKQSISEFADYLCHEIRNPLHGIAANTDFMVDAFRTHRQGVLDIISQDRHPYFEEECNDMMEYLMSIRACANHQALMVNNVLDLSRLEAGKGTLDESLFRPDSVIEEVVKMLKGRIEEGCLQMQLDLHPESKVFMKGDSTKLRQIFVNLISNAIKFTPQHGLIIVSMEKPISLLEDKIKLKASVKDNGCGMTKEEQESLFQRFSPMKQLNAKKYSGSGLGLNIVYLLLKLMSGSIRVESEKDVGTTFFIDFECSQIPSERQQSFYERISNMQEERGSDMSTLYGDGCKTISKKEVGEDSETKRFVARENESKAGSFPKFRVVLVAEDNAVNRQVMSKCLKKLGYEAWVVSDGKEAVDMFHKHRETIDVVFMDMEMPIMNGRIATQRINDIKAESNLKTPIIALSGSQAASSSSLSDKLSTTSCNLTFLPEAENVGINDILSKPFTLLQLERILNKWEELTSLESS